MRAWHEVEIFNKSAFVILLDTRGCSWRSCYMCGYNNETKTNEDIIAQTTAALEQYGGEEIIKIFTSGSFLDTREISREERKKIFEILPEVDITIETRPEFVTASAMENLRGKKMEIAVGLESANNEVLNRCVNKGFDVRDFVGASRMIREGGFSVKSYLLLKPPFMSESDALHDLKDSIDFCVRYADTISVNPVNVQRGTVVEKLWVEKRYRPPWLWSLRDVLLHSQKYLDKVVVTTMPTGGGRSRGVHNCFHCDGTFLNAIDECRIAQDYEPLSDLQCGCFERWNDSLELERFTYGYPIYY